MHKFYWNGGRHSRGPPAVLPGNGFAGGAASVYNIEPRLSTSKSEHSLNYPHVPIRHDAKTVVRVTSPDTAATVVDDSCPETSGGKKSSRPTGSHRVLLKLRKMSAPRPTSVHEDAMETCSVRSGYMPAGASAASKSTEAFFNYNQTWNERSLRKAATNNSHNYENVYAGEEEEWVPPPYENFHLPPKPASSRYSPPHPNYENFPFADSPRASGRGSSLDGTRIIKVILFRTPPSTVSHNRRKV